MMVVDRGRRSVRHDRFRNFPGFLSRGEVLVLNDTRVIPARLWGTKDGRDIEFLLVKETTAGTWRALCRPARRLRPGDTVDFAEGYRAVVTAADEEGGRTLRFSPGSAAVLMARAGYAPLPPYIKRGKKMADRREEDLSRYQTVFAGPAGSIAAPTAGLHFTPEVLTAVEARGVEIAWLTLNVGLATFRPVRARRVEDHRLLEEDTVISPEAARAVNAARSEGRPVTAVGTTSVRALESAAAAGDGRVLDGRRAAGLFIRPGYEFRVVDRLLTNFHLPKSTLLMLVAALAGLDLVQSAYAEAVRERYRFFSYGDCMLII